MIKIKRFFQILNNYCLRFLVINNSVIKNNISNSSNKVFFSFIYLLYFIHFISHIYAYIHPKYSTKFFSQSEIIITLLFSSKKISLMTILSRGCLQIKLEQSLDFSYLIYCLICVLHAKY